MHLETPSDKSSDDRPTLTSSHRLLEALSPQEIARLIEALFAVLSPKLQEEAIAQLSPDTYQTVKQILREPQTTPTVSLEKQAQTWSQLLREWNDIISEACDGEGKYTQGDDDWEGTYFDATALVEALEAVAERMLPLLQTAFEHSFTSDFSFVSALLEAELDISESLDEWMEMSEGLCLERQLTYCLLWWKWLSIQERRDAFHLVRQIRQYEEQFQDVELDRDAIVEFLLELPQGDKRIIFIGLTDQEETPLWKQDLKDIELCWHRLYFKSIEQYASDRYLDKLRKTIPQRWQNGLPIIESFQSKENHEQSLVVIEKPLEEWLAFHRADPAWMPEKSLLIATSSVNDRENTTLLLRYYRETAPALNQSERANALAIQEIAIAQWFDGSTMLATLAEIPVSESTRQALFISWQDYVARQSKPGSWYSDSRSPESVDTWWVSWLINSVADPQKGVNEFQQQINQWIAHLPGSRRELGEDYDILRLLTKDLMVIQNQGKPSYPQFYEVAIAKGRLSSPDDRSRRSYLKEYAPEELWEQAIAFWKTNFHHYVPRPESATKSNYDEQARWMTAVQELSPQSFQTLLSQWRTAHGRCNNPWKAMKAMGLED